MRDSSEVGDFAKTRKAMNGKQSVIRSGNEVERAMYTSTEF